jgi:LDH2 family malate/lactate/ureidoglycolate dehydrogenase
VVSGGKIEVAKRQGKRIPEGWALDHSGRPTRDPALALEAGRLLPLGSLPETSSYKGYGLAVAVDILCGVLSGGSFGLELSGAWGDQAGVAHIGHFHAAIKIEAVKPFDRFLDRIDELLSQLTHSPPAGAPRVRYASEPEDEVERDCRIRGISLHPEVVDQLKALAYGRDLGLAWERLVSNPR